MDRSLKLVASPTTRFRCSCPAVDRPDYLYYPFGNSRWIETQGRFWIPTRSLTEEERFYQSLDYPER